MDSRERKISVLMLPWLAHGHTSPFLELAKKLTHRNFHIYFCSTPIILNSIKEKLDHNNNYNSLSIKLVEFHLPSSPDLPPHYHTTNGLPTHLMTTLKTTFDMSGPIFSDILQTLNPDLAIYDHNQPWAATIASSHNIPAVQFLIFGVVSSSFTLHMFKNPDKPFPFKEIFFRGFKTLMSREMVESSVEEVMKDKYRYLEAMKQSCEIVLIKSCRDLEGKYIDYLSVLAEKKIVPVGALVEDPINKDEDLKIIDWLDKKDVSSTVFVSFGSECFLSKDEIEELAHGLEFSEVNFIWAVRFPLGEKIRVSETLPEGFLVRVGERGLIVEGWAPQAKILRHSSTGGFVSHCGWSPVVESMNFGVPIIAMPMQLDQPLNVRLVEEVGVGLEVMRDENDRFNGKEIAQVIRKVMVEENGEGIRNKARGFTEKIRRKGEEEIDRAVEELVKLCRERNVLEK